VKINFKKKGVVIMFQGFVIAFREVFEIILVIAVMVGVIQKLNQRNLLKSLNIGLVLGVVLSILLGVIVFVFYERLKESFEGVEIALKILLLILITWFLVLAINFQKRDFKQETYQKVINFQKYSVGIFLLSFANVFREGAEMVIFSLASFAKDKSFDLFYGVLFGILAAIVAGYLLFRFSKRINIKVFFIATTLILVAISSEILKDLARELLKEVLKTENNIIPNILSIGYLLTFLVLLIRANVKAKRVAE